MSEEKVEKTEKTEKAEKAEKKKGGGKKQKGSRIELAGDELSVSPKQTPRLRKKYSDEVVPALMKQFSLKTKMQVPRLEKVVINCAVKDAVGNPGLLDTIADELTLISGQKAVITRAKKAIASFKVRQGVPLAARVTLRRARMYEFLDRMMNVALPRVRDFKGVSPRAFDGRGNYSLGIKEQIIFPEISYEKVEKIVGLTVSIVTTAKDNEQARALLTELGMPFRR